MPPKIALLVCAALIVWLFVRERKGREPLSAALWLPLAWVFLVGSKPVSMWLQMDGAQSAVDYLEGSPLDRMVFFTLIAGGLIVLLQRRESWISIIWNNKWVFAFYFYLGLSVLWSDYSFVSFKRWVKDFGNVVMALVVLSELKPAEAVRSLLLRCAFLLVPLSVLVIKYFPEVGRYYDRWSYTAYFSGVAGDKNLLGMLLFVTGLFLFSTFLDSLREVPGRSAGMSRPALILLMIMTLWLLLTVRSATAVLCTFVSAGVLYVLKRSGPQRLIVYGLILAVALLFFAAAVNVPGLVASLLGRDTTLTGRTEIWKSLLSEAVNPLVGAGFYSFWLGDRTEALSKKYHFTLNEAHNGYLELYLNNGLIGLSLLAGLLIAAIFSEWQGLKLRLPGAPFRFSFLIGTVIYNMTEATFNRMSIIWFTFLLIVVVYPRPHDELEVLDATGRIPAAADVPGSPFR